MASGMKFKMSVSNFMPLNLNNWLKHKHIFYMFLMHTQIRPQIWNPQSFITMSTLTSSSQSQTYNTLKM